MAYDDNGEPVPVVHPPAGLGDCCPHCARPYDGPDQAAAAPVDMAALLKAHALGKADGQRELLATLFRGAVSAQQIVERASVLAFAEVWPEGSCPLTPSDLAAFTGVSERTAARRAAAARLAGR